MAQISIKQMASYVVTELEEGATTKSVAEKIAAYLVDSRQSRDVTQLLRAVDAELSKRGRTQVHITSVYGVSDEVKHQLAKILHVNNPVFSEETDSRVIGGVRAEAGEKVIDLTIQNKLQQFKASITRSQA